MYICCYVCRALKVQVQVQQLCQGRLKTTTIKYAESDRASVCIVNLPCSSNENPIAQIMQECSMIDGMLYCA